MFCQLLVNVSGIGNLFTPGCELSAKVKCMGRLFDFLVVSLAGRCYLQLCYEKLKCDRMSSIFCLLLVLRDFCKFFGFQ